MRKIKITDKIKKKIEASKEKKVAKQARTKAVTVKKAPLPEIFGLHNLVRPKGSHKSRKIKGRGPGSGHGKTSTRGSKGQTSRAGRHFYLGFEGGQSPLIRRFPKRGFYSISRKVYQIVNLEQLKGIKETTISLELLQAKGLIRDKAKLVKILGDGEIKVPVTIQAHAFSKKAQDKISGAGGKIEVISV